MAVTAIHPGEHLAEELKELGMSATELARKLTEACPVDIYAQDADGTLEIVEKNLDECVLCRLCLDASPPGAVKIIKLYDGDAILA